MFMYKSWVMVKVKRFDEQWLYYRHNPILQQCYDSIMYVDISV